MNFMATKVGFILPVNGISGGMYVVYRHAQFLANQGYEVDILFASESHGIQVTHYPGFTVPTRSLKCAKEARETYDLLLATGWGTFYDLFELKAHRYGYFCQSDERRFYSNPRDPRLAWVDFTYRYPSTAFVTEARWIQDWLNREYGQKAHYAPNGVDTQLFTPEGSVVERRGSRQRILLEGPGRTPYKRVGLAFRVAEQVRRMNPGSEIWYVSGDGYLDAAWKPDRVFEKLSLSEMAEVYRSCDILLKLSTVEGFFGPPLEMMACGGTAVVTRVTGWDEYIREGENALVVDLDDESAAIAAVDRLLQDTELRTRLSRAGLETARQLDWSKRLPLFEHAVREMIHEPVLSRARWDDKARLAVFRGLRRLKRTGRC